jgi:hypothetical protein
MPGLSEDRRDTMIERYTSAPWGNPVTVVTWWQVTGPEIDATGPMLFSSPDTAASVASAMNVAYAAGVKAGGRVTLLPPDDLMADTTGYPSDRDLGLAAPDFRGEHRLP